MRCPNLLRKTKADLLKLPYFEIIHYLDAGGVDIYFITKNASFEQLLSITDLQEVAGVELGFHPVLIRDEYFYFQVSGIDDEKVLEDDLFGKFGPDVEVIHYFEHLTLNFGEVLLSVKQKLSKKAKT